MLDLLLFLLNCCTAKKSVFPSSRGGGGGKGKSVRSRSRQIEFLSGLSDQVLVYLE